jgi:ribose transport system substrate-binding protein
MKVSTTTKAFVRALVVLCCVGPILTEGKDLHTVGIAVANLGNPFFTEIAHGAESKAKEINPNVKTTALSSDYDVNRQANQIDDFIASKVDLIILNAADSKGIGAAVRRAKAAGITVVAVDVAAEGGVDATVSSDNKQAGEKAAQYIADRLKGKGQVIIVNGPPVSAIQDRVFGANDVFKKYPEIRILSQDQNSGSSREGGLRVMTDLLTAYPKVDAVFATCDPTAIGCDLAAKQAQRKDFFMTSVDGAPEATVALKDPTSLLTATAAQDPFAMAAKAVEVGYGIISDKKPSTSTVLIPVQLVTRDNLDEYKGWTSN